MVKKFHVIESNPDINPANPAPPRALGVHGGALWSAVLAEHDVSDAAGAEMLCAACQAVDRAEACRAAIDKDGEVLKLKTGWREHPLLRHELAARSFTVRTLHKLGLDSEPVRTVGRPPESGR